MGCDAARCQRRARARMVIIRAMSTRLFHAFFGLARCTFRWKAACRAAQIPQQKGRPIPHDHLWQQWLDVRLIAHQGHMGEICFACDAFSCGCSEGTSLCYLETIFPLPPPWNKDTGVLSRLMRNGCLPACTPAAQLWYDCHNAWACFLVSGAQKARPFLVSESESENGLAFWAPCEIP